MEVKVSEADSEIKFMFGVFNKKIMEVITSINLRKISRVIAIFIDEIKTE